MGSKGACQRRGWEKRRRRDLPLAVVTSPRVRGWSATLGDAETLLVGHAHGGDVDALAARHGGFD